MSPSEDMRKMIREEIEPLCHQVGTLNELLTGNGTPERGVIVRLDRLEQQSASNKTWIGYAASSAVAAIVAWLVSLFGGR